MYYCPLCGKEFDAEQTQNEWCSDCDNLKKCKECKTPTSDQVYELFQGVCKPCNTKWLMESVQVEEQTEMYPGMGY